MKTNLGFRIVKQIERPDRALVEKFRGIPSSNINDLMNRMFCMGHELRPMNRVPLLGTAVTVKAPMGDNLALTKAMDMAREGDVIVVDGEGCEDRALMGEMMLTFCEKKGIAGFIIDGAIRDSEAMRRASIPMYCRAVAPQGPFKHGPGEVNVPISCGGQVVFPGDILVGDEDGVVVIRPEYAEELAAEAAKKHEGEVRTLARRDEDAKSGELFRKHEEKYSKMFEALGGQWVEAY